MSPSDAEADTRQSGPDRLNSANCGRCGLGGSLLISANRHHRGGWNMEYVDNDGTRIAYQVCGRGEPLVLIHGWSNEGRYWDEFHRPSPNSRTEREEVQLATGPRAGGALCASWAEGRITASESPKQPQGGPAKAQTTSLRGRGVRICLGLGLPRRAETL